MVHTITPWLSSQRSEGIVRKSGTREVWDLHKVSSAISLHRWHVVARLTRSPHVFLARNASAANCAVIIAKISGVARHGCMSVTLEIDSDEADSEPESDTTLRALDIVRSV